MVFSVLRLHTVINRAFQVIDLNVIDYFISSHGVHQETPKMKNSVHFKLSSLVWNKKELSEFNSIWLKTRIFVQRWFHAKLVGFWRNSIQLWLTCPLAKLVFEFNPQLITNFQIGTNPTPPSLHIILGNIMVQLVTLF